MFNNRNIIQGLANRETTGKFPNAEEAVLKLDKIVDVINEESKKLTEKYDISIEHHNRNYATQFEMNKRKPIHGTAVLIIANDIVSDDAITPSERTMISAAKNSKYLLGAKTKYENLRDDTDNPCISFTTKGTVLGKEEFLNFTETFYRKAEYNNKKPSTEGLAIKDAVEKAIYKKSAGDVLRKSITEMQEGDFITLPENNISANQMNIARNLKNTIIELEEAAANNTSNQSNEGNKRFLGSGKISNDIKFFKSGENPSTSKASNNDSFIDIDEILEDLIDLKQEKAKIEKPKPPKMNNLNLDDIAAACETHRRESVVRVGIANPNISRESDVARNRINKNRNTDSNTR